MDIRWEKSYYFNWSLLEDAAVIIDCLINDIYLHSEITNSSNRMVDILEIALEQIILADETSSRDRNLFGYMSILKTVNELLLKFCYLLINKNINNNFHEYDEIPTKHLISRVNQSLHKTIQKDFSLSLKKEGKSYNHTKNFNDFTHLNNLTWVEMHRAFKEDALNFVSLEKVDVDPSAPLFVAQEAILNVVFLLVVIVYQYAPKILVDRLFIEKQMEQGIVDKKLINSVNPWFLELIENEERFRLHKNFFIDKNKKLIIRSFD